MLYETSSKATYDLSQIIYIVIIGIIGGAKSVSDIITIWTCPVLRKLSGFNRIPNATTIKRVFDRTCINISHLLIELNAFMSKTLDTKKTKRIIIDVDSTVATVYGNQEGAEKGFNPHKKGAKSYHPLLAFNCFTKTIMQGYLRPGNTHSSNNIIGFMKELLALYPDYKFFFRADCGFFDGNLFNFLEKHHIPYLVKARNVSSILKKQEWKTLSQEDPVESGFTEFCEFEYACKSWTKKRTFRAMRRLVLKKLTKKQQKKKSKSQTDENQLLLFDIIELSDIEESIELTEDDPGYTWVYEYVCCIHSENSSVVNTHKQYKKRGTCETWIDEAKNQTALCKIKTKNFKANDIFFHCSIISYNVIRYMTVLSKDKVLIRFEIQTIRTFLIRVAGKLVCGGNQFKLKYTEGLLYERQWDSWCSHI